MTLSVSISSNLDHFALEVDFEAPKGVTAIFGASGAGKTTVINAIAGLHHPDRGRIAHEDAVFFDTASKVSLPTADRQLGYVFQDHRLFPHLDVAANLMFGRKAKGLKTNAALWDRVVEMLAIGQLLKRYPVDLSGGEKQRVAIGRALLAEPKVLLLDEPLASLDHARRLEILPYLERLRDHTDLPILYVSHSVSEVARLANQVVLLDRGQQVKVGSVTEVFADPKISHFFGPSDLGSVIFAKPVKTHEDGVSELETSGGTIFVNQSVSQSHAAIRVRIRAQDVMLSLTKPTGISALNSLSGTICGIEMGQGNGVLLQLRCGDDVILSRITERSWRQMDLKVGMPIFAVLKTVSMAQDDIGFNQ